MQFEVRALDGNGAIQILSVSASSNEELQGVLSDQGYQILSSSRSRVQESNRFSPVTLSEFVSELATLLDAGLSATEALEAMGAQGQNSRQGQLASGLKAQLKRGSTFSEAIKRTVTGAPTLLVAMVRANENTGLLSQAFRRYAKLVGEMQALKSRAIAALTYPSILFVASMIVFFFLLGFVVPRFASSLSSSTQKMPWASQLLFSTSAYLKMNLLPLGIFIVLLVVLILFFGRRYGWSNFLDKVLRSTPWVNSKYHEAVVARLLLTTGSLLESGLTVLESLELAKATLPFFWQRNVEQAKGLVRVGTSTSEALRSSGLVLPISARLLQIGERSGAVAKQMHAAAAIHEQALSQAIEKFLRLAEPLLLALIGLIVGGVVVLLYLPIFEIAQWSRR
jgi:general secretion pathway protein F